MYSNEQLFVDVLQTQYLRGLYCPVYLTSEGVPLGVPVISATALVKRVCIQVPDEFFCIQLSIEPDVSKTIITTGVKPSLLEDACPQASCDDPNRPMPTPPDIPTIMLNIDASFVCRFIFILRYSVPRRLPVFTWSYRHTIEGVCRLVSIILGSGFVKINFRL